MTAPNREDESDAASCAVDLEGAEGEASADELGFDPGATDKPILVWDGTCGFCRRSVEHIRDRAGDRLHYVEYQRVHRYFEEIDEGDFERAVHLVEPSGLFYAGAEAVYHALTYGGGTETWRFLYDNVPPFAMASEGAYRWVAEHRPLVSKLATWLFGEDLRSSRFQLARWLFFRGLGIVFLIAFVSLGVQILGLVGAEGIVPASDFVERIREVNRQPGRTGSLFWEIPTIFWVLEPTDTVLTGICTVGGLLSAFLVAGVWHRGVLVLLWALYLSLATTSGPFLGYQWDILLLEAAFLGLFVAPSGLWAPRGGRRVGRGALFLCHWLAFRLFFMSGVVKLTSQDPTWRDGTALTYHFWTQPLPTWTAYWVDQLPALFHWLGTQATFVIELAIPFLVFAPRRMKRLAAYAFLALQATIFATGNYGFFNILTAVVCLLLIDDVVWRSVLPDRLVEWFDRKPVEPGDSRFRTPKRVAMALVVLAVVGITSIKMIGRFSRSPDRNPLGIPQFVLAVSNATDGFRTLNNYGLFADMTESRPEIIVQGSRNGEEWKTYDFPWKPDRPGERPKFVEPHQPRLDWQMWFQALALQRTQGRAGRCGYSRWFIQFQRRLLEGNETVLGLLEHNPFPDRPPRFVRTIVYDYQFTELGSGTDDWWRATNRRKPCPTVTLRNGQLRRATPGR